MDAEYRNDEIDVILLARKMLSYKTLMAAFLVLGIVASIIWGVFFYKASVDLSVSYVPKVFSDSTLSSKYGVKYVTPDELVSSIVHTNTAEAFLSEKGIDETEISPKGFLKPLTVAYGNGIISITLD